MTAPSNYVTGDIAGSYLITAVNTRSSFHAGNCTAQLFQWPSLLKQKGYSRIRNLYVPLLVLQGIGSQRQRDRKYNVH